MSLYLRSANERDIRKVFDWANEETTRANSFHTEKISWEEHTSWYQKVLQSEEVSLYIAMDFMKPVGQVRLQKEADTGFISYSVDKDCRGAHIGRKMLALLEKEARGKVKRLVGEVKSDNIASRHTFEKLGYQKTKEDSDRLVYTKELDGPVANLQKPKRDARFEVLRVVAMLMVIMLHYLSKGGLLVNPAEVTAMSEWGFWIVEAFCLVCVNVYVLISGYFLTESRFCLGKLAQIWCQVFFYSVVIAAVCMGTGLVDYHQYLNFYDLQFLTFPVMNGHYWFASAYIIMYLFSPVINAAVRTMKKGQLQLVIFALLVPFCFAKSVLPISLKLDDYGNSFVWFLCLYLIAAYIRLYGIPFLEKKRRAFPVYLLSVAGILLALAVAAWVNRQTGQYDYAMEIPLHYNFIFVLTGSLGLFYCFKNWKIRENGLVRFLVRIAPYTFGVYLLHEHLMVRYLWPEAFRISEPYGAFRICHMIVCVLIVFSVGILIDWLRSILFKGLDHLIVIGLRIYYAKREAMDYLIFGGLTTVVNWLVYTVFAYGLLVPVLGGYDTERIMVSNVIAWIVAVLFAYWTNRTFVFCSQVHGALEMWKEFAAFVSARITSFLVESLLLFLMVDWLAINDLVSKLLISVVTIVLNYIFSKLWIFKKKEETK